MLTPTKLEGLKTARKILARMTADKVPAEQLERRRTILAELLAEVQRDYNPNNPTDVRILELSGLTADDLK